jgi:mono/diheme cytochrome c family protein
MLMGHTTRRVLITAALALASGMAAAAAAAGQDAAAVKKGEGVYTAQKCQMCHQIAGKGSKANPLDGVGAKLSADDIKQWITHPTDAAAKAKSTKKPPMPNKYGTLPAADLDALVAYMASLK